MTPAKGQLSTKQPGVWQSVADWPKGTLHPTKATTTTDDHATPEQATGVCELLKRDGLGGDKKVFPIRAYIRVKPESFQAMLKGGAS